MENQNTLNHTKPRPALFLDRDGVVNIDRGHVFKSEQVEFIDGVFELVKTANFKNYLVIIITNQSGIAKGYYSTEDFNILTSWMSNEFLKQSAFIDQFYHCPHHPHEGLGSLNTTCYCRKPLPGMILKASQDFNLDLDKSIIVGDNITDILAGIRGKVGNLFLLQQPIEQSTTPIPVCATTVHSLRDVRLMRCLYRQSSQ